MKKGPKILFVIKNVRYIQGSLYRENLYGVCLAESKGPDI